MKRCPACQRTYTDDSLIFCLEDGAMLLDASGSSDPMASTLLDSPPSTSGRDRSASTEVFHSGPTSDNPASPTRAWGTPNVGQPSKDSWDARRYSGQQGVPFNPPPPPALEVRTQKRSWPGVTALFIGIVTSLMMLGVFVAAGFKLDSKLIGFGFLAALFLSIFGVVFGLVAFGVAVRNPDRYGGKAVALVGMFMSLVPTLFLLLLLAVGIAVTSK
jgi:hypothetical protein